MNVSSNIRKPTTGKKSIHGGNIPIEMPGETWTEEDIANWVPQGSAYENLNSDDFYDLNIDETGGEYYE